MSGFLKDQEEFANSDLGYESEVVPFANVFDKGYIVILDCVKHGNQHCW